MPINKRHELKKVAPTASLILAPTGFYVSCYCAALKYSLA